MNVPLVIESTGDGEQTYDVYSRLLKDRIIFLSDEITPPLASSIIAQILFLNRDDTKKDIEFYIMSPGGDVNATLAIYDTMQYVSNDISTVCIGEACSGAALLLAAGTKGKRLSLPSARIMLHQPSGGMEGDAASLSIAHEEMMRVRSLLNRRLAKHTGKSEKTLEKDLDRDMYLGPEEAVKYGILDKVVQKK